jgi:putative SOS response-associated peptidase YedK
MCGRFELHSAFEIIARIFGLGTISVPLRPRYNIAPGQDIPIVLNEGQGRTLVLSRWGLLPPWAKDEKDGYRMINARAETVAEKPSFRSAFAKHRCLVVADGFYEWKQEGARKKPFYVRLRSGGPFGFAGLYSDWHAPDGGTVRTSTIITTDANGLLAPIHDRMPVIVRPDQYELWLDSSVQEKDRLLPLLRPSADDELELYEVAAAVSSPKNDSAENIERISGSDR